MNDNLKLGKNEENSYLQQIQELDEKLNLENAEYKFYLERLNLIKTLIIFESSVYSESYFLTECNKVLEMLLFDLKNNTKDADLYYYIAVLYEMKKDTNNNKKYINKALKVNPNHLLSRIYLTEKLAEQNGEAVTETKFTELLNLYPDNILIYKTRALTRDIKFYNFDGAKEDYEKLKELDEENISEYNWNIDYITKSRDNPKMQELVASMRKPKKNVTLPQILLIFVATAIVILIVLSAKP